MENLQLIVQGIQSRDWIIVRAEWVNTAAPKFHLRPTVAYPLQVPGLLNESHPRGFQTIALSFFIAFKARFGLVRQG